MYKFNFLKTINLQKQETSQRNKFITTVFLISVSAQIVLLGMLFLKSTSVNTSYDEAITVKNKYEKLTNDFRKKDFFGYKNIKHSYNVHISRRQLTYLFKSFETSLDTTMIIQKFDYVGSIIELNIVSRTKGSKSKLMSEINSLKSNISTAILLDNYIANASEVELVKGPDLKSREKNADGTQYWSFTFSINLMAPKINVKPKKVAKAPQLKH